MTYFRLPLIAILTTLFTLIASPVVAGDCTRLCKSDFIRDATAQDIQAEINKGADVRERTEDGLTPLHNAARWDNAEAITVLLQAGADIEARNKDGVTPLHRAARWGKAEAVIALLQAGADGKARDEDGKTPFDLAKNNEKLKNTKAYWLLNEAQY